jgi:pimeloyl-ACP methyl ester carboxylesterase
VTVVAGSPGTERTLVSVSAPRPYLPPSQPVVLSRRGTTWVYDTGAPPGRPERPAVLLLHGWTSTAALNWFRCFRVLSAEYRVVAMDHRGHGRGIRSRSPFRLEDCADDAACLIEAMDLGPVTAVGYSMGGPVAQLLWNRHPDVVDGLVLCATATSFGARQQLTGPVGRLGLGASMALSFVPAAVRQRGMTLATRNWAANAAAADWAIEEWSRHDPSALIQAGLALSRFDSGLWIGEIDVPASVVVTTLDQVVAPSRQWAMMRSIPGAVAFPVPGHHRVCVDEPARFVPALLSACRAVRRDAAPAV